MRQGQQNRRNRGRNSRKGQQNSSSRNYESNGPGVKIRGTAAHIAEKYILLARDALSSSDTISAENLLQHAEHYNRIVMSLQSQAADANSVSEKDIKSVNGSGVQKSNGKVDLNNAEAASYSNQEVSNISAYGQDTEVDSALKDKENSKNDRSSRGMNGRRRSRKRVNGHANGHNQHTSLQDGPKGNKSNFVHNGENRNKKNGKVNKTMCKEVSEPSKPERAFDEQPVNKTQPPNDVVA